MIADTAETVVKAGDDAACEAGMAPGVTTRDWLQIIEPA